VYVDWVAWDTTAVLPSATLWREGVATVTTAGSTGDVQPFTVTIGNPNTFYVADPIVIASVAAASAPGLALAVTVTDRSNSQFTLNVACNGCKLPKGLQLQVSWLAFLRDTYEYTVQPGSVQRTIVQGALVQEAQLVFGSAEAMTVRIYGHVVDGPQAHLDSGFVEVVNDIGPLGPGQEMVLRAYTNLLTQITPTTGVFFTDDNGLEVEQRMYNLMKEDPVSGNYYPASQRVWLKDLSSGLQFVLIGDRSHGCGSGSSGFVECMLHRRCLADDYYGVGEVLNEQTHVDPTFRLVLDDEQGASRMMRHQGVLQENPVYVLFGSKPMSPSSWSSQWPVQTSELQGALPENLHLLSLNMMRALPTSGLALNGTVLRLQHLFPLGE
jgi:lysosomal alpha-mannosidase